MSDVMHKGLNLVRLRERLQTALPGRRVNVVDDGDLLIFVDENGPIRINTSEEAVKALHDIGYDAGYMFVAAVLDDIEREFAKEGEKKSESDHGDPSKYQEQSQITYHIATEDVPFIEVRHRAIGQCFLYSGQVYMRISPFNNKISSRAEVVHAIDLGDGMFSTFNPSIRVIPVRMKLDMSVFGKGDQ